MSATTHTQRREPVQERSRRTVTRILDAAAALIDETGVDAATTRAIADRAGVSYPSLYRFFADREEILDRLIERHLAELEALSDTAERTWKTGSITDLVHLELELHVNYYRQNPGAARLWIGGRTSPTVTRQVRARIRVLADRMRHTVISAGLVPADTDPLVFLVTVELGDRILDLAFRDRDEPEPAMIELGRTALDAYIERVFPAAS
jgi:AcrR family transcriptional regulator